MRRTTVLTLIALLLLGMSCVGFADQTLTVTLDPTQPEPPKAEADLALKHETLTAPPPAASPPNAGTKVTATDTSTTNQVPIGRVGIVTAQKAEIRSLPDKKAYTLYTCQKDTSIALVGQNGDWYGVLMINSSVGWIEKSKVNLLEYQVLGQPSQMSAQGNKIVDTAVKYLGIPYKWGGYSTAGVDCSGFVKAVFASHGVNLPRVSRNQALVGTLVNLNQLQPGDRLYFACKGGAIDHTGIYMGNGLFIHSSGSRGGVAVDELTKSFYLNSIICARR